MSIYRCGGLACCLALLAAPALAATLHVPSGYSTIQAALDAAQDGDEIVVSDGWYSADGDKNLDFLGKAVTLRSASADPVACTIYIYGSGRGFWFHNGESPAARVDGFTVSGGYCSGVEAWGAGILCTNGSSPTISNCVLEDCGTHGSYGAPTGGGGIACRDASHPSLLNCTIDQCEAYEGYGGGVLCDGGSSPTFTGCTICNCTASGSVLAQYVTSGGVVCLNGSSITLTDCVIENNSADYGAGGLACCSSGASLRGCTITGNQGHYAGGVYCDHSSPTLHDCTFAENAGWCASGMFCDWYSYPEVTACRLTAGMPANGSDFPFPPAIVCRAASSVTLASCLIDDAGSLWAQCYGATMARNCTFMGTVVSSYSSTALLQSSIFWPAAVRVYSLADFPGQMSLSYCDVQGGEAAVQVDPGSVLSWGAGNIDADPDFVSPAGPDGDPATWQDNDYHLSAGSPCIDTGVPGFTPQTGETDIDGQYRVWQADVGLSGRVDMGADEFAAPAFGDLNCDGGIDGYDIDPFVLALTDPVAYSAEYPLCGTILADLNADGAVNGYDIDPFVSRLTSGQADGGRD